MPYRKNLILYSSICWFLGLVLRFLVFYFKSSCLLKTLKVVPSAFIWKFQVLSKVLFIYFVLIFLQGERYKSNFILLQVEILFSQHKWLNWPSFSQSIFCLLYFKKESVGRTLLFYICVFYTFPLVYIFLCHYQTVYISIAI